MEQNTKEWLEMRKNCIGASDAPIIMGTSPWKTALQLWEEKLGLREPPQMNAAMARGHELEPIARQAYNDQTGNCVEEEVVFHPEYKWMMASLDGISLDRSMVVEIKCPGQADHDLAGSGIVPEKYYAQLQHQLATICLNQLHYFSYRDGEFHLIEVKRDEKFIKSMILKEKAFYKCMQDFDPPAMTDRDFEEKTDDASIKASLRWREAQDVLADAKEKEKLAREQLIAVSGDRNCKIGGVKVQKVVRKGSIDYKAVPELKEVNLEKYRKAPVASWRLTC